MEALPIFVSVGSTATPQQEAFIRAVEDRLRSEGLVPCTVGRNMFSSDAPLRAVTELLDSAAGAVVVALERSFFPAGVEKRGGPSETVLIDTRLATPWNQIEAAMAYSRGQPLLVIVEAGLKSEGLLERGYDWFVQWVTPTPEALTSLEFNGVLASWKKKVEARAKGPRSRSSATVAGSPSIGDLTIGELISGLRPGQLWSLLGAMAAMLAGAVALGAKLHF